MNISLNIENDQELRAYIKDCIKGQVLSIMRDELTAVITKELERKWKGLDKSNFDRMIKESLKNATRDILYKEHGINRWGSEYIKPFVEELVKESVINTNWRKLVDDLAKEKVKSLIQ